MPLAETLPFGLRDVKLTPVSAAGVLGTSVDLPNGRTMSWEESEDFTTLRGDDKDVLLGAFRIVLPTCLNPPRHSF